MKNAIRSVLVALVLATLCFPAQAGGATTEGASLQLALPATTGEVVYTSPVTATSSSSTDSLSWTGPFPSSMVQPTGSPWQTMHKDGFTGDLAVVAKAMGLTPAHVREYRSMHSLGVCKVGAVPNGTVIDALSFTRGGYHHVQDEGVLVDLKTYSTRNTEICELTDGTYLLRFHGCNNFGVIHPRRPQPLPVYQPAITERYEPEPVYSTPIITEYVSPVPVYTEPIVAYSQPVYPAMEYVAPAPTTSAVVNEPVPATPVQTTGRRVWTPRFRCASCKTAQPQNIHQPSPARMAAPAETVTGYAPRLTN